MIKVQLKNISVVEYAELRATALQFLQVEGHRQAFRHIFVALGQRLTIGIDHHRTPCIMAMLVFAHPIACHQIALILQRSGTSQQLPSRLTGFRPVSHQYHNIVVQGVSITAPTRKAQVVTRQQQHAESCIVDNGMILPWGIELVFVSESEKMMFIVKRYAIIPSIHKIVTITECAVRQLYSQTARDGTMVLAGGFFHPQQCRVRGLVGSDAMRLGGKTRAPHLWQDIQIASFCFSEQSAGLVDIFLGLSPANIGLKKRNFQYSSSFTDGFPLKETIWSMR